MIILAGYIFKHLVFMPVDTLLSRWKKPVMNAQMPECVGELNALFFAVTCTHVLVMITIMGMCASTFIVYTRCYWLAKLYNQWMLKMREAQKVLQQQSQLSHWIMKQMKTTFLVLQLHLKESTLVTPQVFIDHRCWLTTGDALTLCLSTGYEVPLRTTRAFLLELEKHIFESASHIAPYLSYINAHLHNAVLACRAAQDRTSTESPSFSNKQHIPSGKKPKHQWRFTKTKKTPGRKRKGNTLQ